MGAEILTAKCSELNVIVPGSEFEGGEYKEFALPEQFISKWNATTKKYETECMSNPNPNPNPNPSPNPTPNPNQVRDRVHVALGLSAARVCCVVRIGRR